MKLIDLYEFTSASGGGVRFFAEIDEDGTGFFEPARGDLRRWILSLDSYWSDSAMEGLHTQHLTQVANAEVMRELRPVNGDDVSWIEFKAHPGIDRIARIIKEGGGGSPPSGGAADPGSAIAGVIGDMARGQMLCALGPGLNPPMGWIERSGLTGGIMRKG